MATFQKRDDDGRMVTFTCSAEFRAGGPELIWSVSSDTTDGGEFQDLLRDEIGGRTCWNNGLATFRKLIELGCPQGPAIWLVQAAVRGSVLEPIVED